MLTMLERLRRSIIPYKYRRDSSTPLLILLLMIILIYETTTARNKIQDEVDVIAVVIDVKNNSIILSI